MYIIGLYSLQYSRIREIRKKPLGTYLGHIRFSVPFAFFFAFLILIITYFAKLSLLLIYIAKKIFMRKCVSLKVQKFELLVGHVFFCIHITKHWKIAKTKINSITLLYNPTSKWTKNKFKESYEPIKNFVKPTKIYKFLFALELIVR